MHGSVRAGGLCRFLHHPLRRLAATIVKRLNTAGTCTISFFDFRFSGGWCISGSVSEGTHNPGAVAQGEPKATEELLPLVHAELQRPAAHKMAVEPAGHTFQPTALVHEACLRLSADGDARFTNQAHSFAVAAHSMRRISIEHARRKQRQRRSGRERVDLERIRLAQPLPADELLAVDAALNRLGECDREATELVELRFFGRLTQEEAKTLGVWP